jgi:hypothetical protein
MLSLPFSVLTVLKKRRVNNLDSKLISIPVELDCNFMTRTECFLSLQTVVVVTEECNVMVNSDELIRAAEYLKL